MEQSISFQELLNSHHQQAHIESIPLSAELKSNEAEEAEMKDEASQNGDEHQRPQRERNQSETRSQNLGQKDEVDINAQSQIPEQIHAA